jgi:hypothetical protein
MRNRTHTNSPRLESPGPAPSDSGSSADSELVVRTPRQYHALQKLFSKVYKRWIRSQDPNHEDVEKLSKQVISVDEFIHLTGNKARGHFIALIDNHLRFDELPLPPHGNIIHHIAWTFSNQFRISQEDNSLGGSGDNCTACIPIYTYYCRC